jgi:hypothetical protein
MTQANKMNIEKAIELATKKGLSFNKSHDRYGGRERTFVYFYRKPRTEDDPSFLITDWDEHARVVPHLLKSYCVMTPRFYEDLETVMIIARTCWEG